jgi:hypothetical protein
LLCFLEEEVCSLRANAFTDVLIMGVLFIRAAAEIIATVPASIVRGFLTCLQHSAAAHE